VVSTSNRGGHLSSCPAIARGVSKIPPTECQNLQAITDAATQIAIAAQSILQQEHQIVQKLSSAILQSQSGGFSPYAALLCFPTIVTTANLYTCEFQDENIDLATGEIPWNKARLIKCPYLLFNYALPVALQPSPVVTDITYESYWEAAQIAARMPIFVVQSKALPTFLDRVMLPTSHGNAYGLPTEVWRTLDLHPETVTIQVLCYDARGGS